MMYAVREDWPTGRLLCECPSCGTLQMVAALPACASARCIRCNQLLRRTRYQPLVRPLAAALAGLALYGVVLFLPFMQIELWSRDHTATMLEFPAELQTNGFWELAAAFLLFVLVLPPLRLALLAWVLIGLRLRRPPRGLRALFRCHERSGPWAMTEVFLVGVFVAYSRLADLAQIDIGPAAWALGGLMLASVCAEIALDPAAVWEAIDSRTPRTALAGAKDEGNPVGCPCCALLCHPRPDRLSRCLRCGALLWPRKPASLARTWALLIAAVICVVFAYAEPVMTVSNFGEGETSTIFGGMIELAELGWWPIAVIVFLASITIPMFKLVALAVMLLSVHLRSATGLRARTRIYRFVEVIGRWSMIDVFMVSILTVLVQLGFIATVQPEVGVVAFGAVVILTMLAAYSFDPRLMWDAAGRGRGAE
ncbi:MAG: paraquat-inducible protein A [Acetobacteraceae bacterium]|nr:paraquat-inducible protein A [Acetobacteraceae bacterium]